MTPPGLKPLTARTGYGPQSLKTTEEAKIFSSRMYSVTLVEVPVLGRDS